MKNARRIWLSIHLYLGLSIGAVLVLLGLTGSILVFYLDIDQILNPKMEPTSVPYEMPAQQDILDALQQAHPTRTDPWRIEQPMQADWPIMARYYTPIESVGKNFAPLMLTVDPITLEVTSSRLWGDYAMTWIYDLHYSLLLDKPGKIDIGIIGLISLISFISGIWLWWPRWAGLKQALKPQLRSGKARLNYDLHVLSGSYGVLLLLILSLTGAALALPDETAMLVKPFSPLTSAPNIALDHGESADRITADQAVEIANNRFPDAELRWVETPGLNNQKAWRIALYQEGEPSRRFPRTQVWIDPVSGEILGLRDTKQDTGGDVLMHWLHPLHNGEVFGMTGRILVFIAGLLPLILFVTGLIRWLQKRRARRLITSRHTA
jgi:uncharacterized iron-regulated membrane protein|tara:strand:+ start:158 stop:1294 length:1137 start_codon:yes stop_codon:yes gene_type:complete